MSYSGTMNIISFWQINMMVVKSLVGTSRSRKKINSSFPLRIY